MPATFTHHDSRPLPLETLGFHESTLLGVDTTGYPGRLRLVIGDALVDGQARSVEVIFEEIGAIQRDGLPMRTPVMEMPDAEILTLGGSKAGQWDLIVKWNNFARRQSRTVAYEITASTAHAVLMPGSAA